jgi:hypothetical protein
MLSGFMVLQQGVGSKLPHYSPFVLCCYDSNLNQDMIGPEHAH